MPEFDILEVLTVLIVYQAIIYSINLLKFRKTKPLFTKVLIVLFVLLLFHFSFIFAEQKWNQLPFLPGPVFGLVYGPVYLLYTKSLVLKSIPVKRNWVHFIPAALMLVLSLILGTRGTAYNLWISLLVTIHFTYYLFLSLLLLYDYRKALKKESSRFYEVSLKWLEAIIYFQFLILVIALAESWIEKVFFGQVMVMLIYILVIVLLHCFYHLGIRQVELFKGLGQEQLKTGKTSEYELPKFKVDEYSKRIISYIEEEQPYLKFDITLTELSEKLDISSRNLSYVINRSFDKNFYDFINGYRLERACSLLRESDQPIKEIMYDSGFSNKGTFNAIFKKNLRMTPTQFRSKNRSSYAQ